MSDRIRLITEQGKQILVVDFSNCPASEVADIARTVPNHVTMQPRRSVLLLVDFVGASFDSEAIRAIKESAVFDKPYIKKAAWIGRSVTLDNILDEIRDFSRREFPVFANFDDGLAWLVRD
jgi:hypothetical protein